MLRLYVWKFTLDIIVLSKTTGGFFLQSLLLSQTINDFVLKGKNVTIHF